MKSSTIIYILVTLFLFSFYSLKAQIFKVSSGNAQVGYQNYKWFGFGYNPASPTSNQSQWGIEHWDGGLNFWKPWPSPYSGNYKMFINDQGQVGINMKPLTGVWGTYGYFPIPFIKLQISGYGVATGWLTWSDSSLKENIEIIDSSFMSKLYQLKPLKYNFKTNGILGGDIATSDTIVEKDSTIKNQTDVNKITDNGLVHFGFTAQEVKSIFPNIVSDFGSIEAINYIELVPILVKAIQVQQKQLEDQKAIIQQMKNTTIVSTTKTVLYQNDPNPFGTHTTFKYYLDENQSITNATIEIRDLTGLLKAILPLVDESGIGQVLYDGSALTVGYYVYSIKVNGVSKDSKMLLIER